MGALFVTLLAVLALALLVAPYAWATAFTLLAGAVVIGGAGFWILLATEFVFLLYCLDNRNDDEFFIGWSTFSVVCVLAIFQFGTSFKPFTFVLEHPVVTIGYFALYVLLGVTWSYGKWWLLNHRHNEPVKQLRRKFLAENNITGDKVPEDQLLTWERYCHSFLPGRGELSEVKLRAFEYKIKLIGWVALWPLSFAWTIVNDPFVKFFNYLYDLLLNSYQDITNAVSREVDEELAGIRRLKESKLAEKEAEMKAGASRGKPQKYGAETD